MPGLHGSHRLAVPRTAYFTWTALLFTIVCLLIGAIAGVLGGLLGIGGGVIVVPALIFLFDHTGILADHAGPGNGTTLVAVGTSLATIIFTSAAAAVTQTRARMVDWQIVRRFTPMVMLASYGSGFIAALLPLATLRASIGFFLGFVSIVMLTNWRPSPHRVLPGAVASAGIAGIAGLVSGIAGIGGGNVVVPDTRLLQRARSPRNRNGERARISDRHSGIVRLRDPRTRHHADRRTDCSATCTCLRC